MHRLHPRLWIALALLLAGCSRHGGPSSGAGVGSTGASAARPPGASLAIAGSLFTGDAEQIRGYLQTVKEVKPTRFDVQWSPDTVAVSKEAALRALISISRDGSIYRFDSREPIVQRLQPGKILWIYDLAVKRVTRVDTSSDITVITTAPVSLTETFTHAHIAFDAAPSLANYYMGFRPHLPQAPRTTRNAPNPPFAHRVAWRTAAARARPAIWDGRSGPQLRDVSDDAPAPGPGAEQTDQDDYGEVRPAGGGFNGTLKGYEYSVGYSTRPDGITLTLQARKADEEGGTDNGGAESGAEIEEKFREADEKREEAEQKLAETKVELTHEQADLDTIDAQYEKDMAKLKADQSTRQQNKTNPNPTPGIPGPKTDSNGTPYTPEAEQQQLTQQYQKQRSLELQKMAVAQQIRDAAEKDKADAEAREKALAVLGNAAKQLFEIASDVLDVRFKIRVDLDNFDMGGAINLDDGSLQSATAQFKNLRGKVALSFIGRMGKPGNGTTKVPIMDVPIMFNIPFPMGGFPFVIQLSCDFNINVFLAGNHAAQSFEGSYEFTGDGGFQSTTSSSQATTTLEGTKPAVGHYAAMSPGVSGAVLGIQAPRIGFGVGVMGASSVAYLDVVHVVTITNSAAVAAGLLAPPCKRITYTAYGHVGVDTKLMPLPIPFVGYIADALSKQGTVRKEVFQRGDEVLDPPVKACEIS
jgi:histone H3/H4